MISVSAGARDFTASITGSCGLPQIASTGAASATMWPASNSWAVGAIETSVARLAMTANSTIMNSTRLSSITVTLSPGESRLRR